MPETYPRFPRHDQVADYLRSYADTFDLTDQVEFGTEVARIAQRSDSTWYVKTRDLATGRERRRRFDHVVVASGHQWEPVQPAIQGAESFLGDQRHSFDYSSPVDYLDKRVVVVGFGSSAADVSVDLSRIAKKTYLSVRRSAHVVPKQMLGIPIGEIASKPWWSRMPFPDQRRFIELVLHVIRGKLTDYGIPEPDHRLFSGTLTISDELLSRISHGDIAVRPVIESFDGPSVRFADGTSAEVDAVVYCTGYRIAFPFLADDCVFADSGQVALYHRVVSPHHRGLYFAGLIRPVGSATRLIEGQAEWIADLVEGSVGLPSTEAMTDEVDAHLAATAARYGTRPVDSIQVDFAPYLDVLARQRSTRATVPA